MDVIINKVKKMDMSLEEETEIYENYYRKRGEAEKLFPKDSNGNIRKFISKNEASSIEAQITTKVYDMANETKDIVERVRQKKWEQAEKYKAEFIKCITMLKTKGLLTIGSFNIENTVRYNNIIENMTFQSSAYLKTVENSDKKHIRFDYGIVGFFKSIGPAIKTIFKPKLEVRVDAEAYKNSIFEPLDGNIDKLVEDVKSAYIADIEEMKKTMSDKMQEVITVIEEYMTAITKRNKKIHQEVTDQTRYEKKKKRLEEDQRFLSDLLEDLHILRQRR